MIGPLPWVGGKNRLATKIISMLPEHTTYVEAFCGGAQVFFHKQSSEVEILNDLDGEVFNFLRICQWHYEELIRFLRYMVVSRSWFELLSQTDPATLTDIQRAGRFQEIALSVDIHEYQRTFEHRGIPWPEEASPGRED